MNPKKSLYFFLYLATLCQFSHGDLIGDVCSKSIQTAFCEKTLRADTRAPKSDIKGLAQITIDKSRSSAESGLALVTKLFNEAKDNVSKKIYETCVKNFQYTVKDTVILADVLNKGEYNIITNYGAVFLTGVNLSDCENGFWDGHDWQGEPLQLAELIGDFSDLGDTLLTISFFLKSS